MRHGWHLHRRHRLLHGPDTKTKKDMIATWSSKKTICFESLPSDDWKTWGRPHRLMPCRHGDLCVSLKLSLAEWHQKVTSNNDILKSHQWEKAPGLLANNAQSFDDHCSLGSHNKNWIKLGWRAVVCCKLSGKGVGEVTYLVEMEESVVKKGRKMIC